MLLGWVLNKTLEYVGLSLSTASDTALLISTESLFTALLSWLLLRERVRPTGMASLIVGLLGAYLIVERGLRPSLGGAAGAGRVIGDVLIVCSLLIEAVYTVRGKSTLARIPPLLFTSATITGSLLFWLPAGAINVVQCRFAAASRLRDGWVCSIWRGSPPRCVTGSGSARCGRWMAPPRRRRSSFSRWWAPRSPCCCCTIS